MKRTILTLILTVAAVLAVTVSSASAGTQYGACGLKAPGAPVINGASFTSAGVARCNHEWTAVAILSVEQGGEWAPAYAQGNPAPPQISGPHPAKQDHTITFSWSNLDLYPSCAYNWRVLVVYQDNQSNEMDAGYSPTTFATCRNQRPQ